MRRMPEQVVLPQTHLIRYAPKARDTWSVLPEVVKFKDPLILDKGYPSSLDLHLWYKFKHMVEQKG